MMIDADPERVQAGATWQLISLPHMLRLSHPGDEKGGVMSDRRRRSMVLAPSAMVATSQPLAVEVGIEILRRGGSAVDAAIATNATLGVVEPMSCGLGGDVFAIVWDAATERLHGFDGCGRAPARMTRQVFADRGLDRIPNHGPLSWSVPGCVDGWFAMHERFGRLPMSDLLAPAIRYADGGFPVSPVIARSWARAEELLLRDEGARSTFLPDARAPRIGERFCNPDLASTLRVLASGGRDAFYRGRIAEKLVSASRDLGALLEAEDLETHESTWVDPICVAYAGYDVWELPPSTQGMAALQMLRILDGFDLRTMGHNSAAYLHHLIESKKLAYADRARYYADPTFADVPMGELISAAYAERQRRRIAPERAALEVTPGDPRLRIGDTVYLSLVDADRNAVSFIQSIYHGFGSGVVPPGLGFAMQNRGSLFHLDPEHPNALEPGKRPFHTIIPGFVTRNGRPVFSFGVMGGDMQPQGHVQILLNLFEFAMDVQEAGDAIRFRHDGSATPVGDEMFDGGTVYLEPGLPQETIDELVAKGHRIEISETGFGGYQGIWIDPETGMLHGGSESRKDGCAIGY
jgi:gamma-glutamyltranspeptidase/glutathione hydrolase